MTSRDRFELVLLGAIWGASFLFMRIAVPELGAVVLIELRMVIAAVFLVAILAWRGQLGALRGRALSFTLLGIVNTALPFILFAFATGKLTAGFAAVINATVPLFGAVFAFACLRERLAKAKVLGLLVGFAGVVVLVSGKLELPDDRLAIGAGLAAALSYGIAAHSSKKAFGGVPPLVVSAGSLVAASVVTAPFCVFTWPAEAPSLTSLGCALALGVVCTGAAYLLYFRSIARIGPMRAMTVTYLIPVFAIVWGGVFLGEGFTWPMGVGACVILVGTTLVARGGAAAKR